MSEDFAAVAARIERNPLGRLMYGQRELFHSNLLAWFFDELPGPADDVFRPFAAAGVDGRRHVQREHKHLDLVLHWPDRAPLVIENKVFSVPDQSQLDAYARVASGGSQTPAFVLLSVSAPTFTPKGWTHLSYAELSSRILAALPAGASYEVETMRRYASLVSDLDRLVSATDIHSDDEPVWLPSDMLSAVHSSQTRAALQKARAQRVARALNDALPGLPTPAKGDLSNATPLVEILELCEVDGREAQAGWQLQGDQFRRALVLRGRGTAGRTAESRARREQIAQENLDLLTFPAFLPQQHAGRKEFNHFAPNFVYRYVKAPGLTVGQLKDAARTIHEEIAGR